MQGDVREDCLLKSGSISVLYILVYRKIFIRHIHNLFLMPDNKNETTTIRIAVSTRERMEKHGNYGETADDILNKLMDKAEK